MRSRFESNSSLCVTPFGQTVSNYSRTLFRISHAFVAGGICGNPLAMWCKCCPPQSVWAKMGHLSVHFPRCPVVSCRDCLACFAPHLGGGPIGDIQESFWNPNPHMQGTHTMMPEMITQYIRKQFFCVTDVCVCNRKMNSQTIDV